MKSFKTLLNVGFATALGAATLGAFNPKEAVAQVDGWVSEVLNLPDIGLRLMPRPNGYRVIGVLEGSMAYDAGIQPQSFLVEVNDKPITSIPPSELRSYFSQDNSKSVKLKIIGNEPSEPMLGTHYTVIDVPLRYTGEITGEKFTDEFYRPETLAPVGEGIKTVYIDALGSVLESKGPLIVIRNAFSNGPLRGFLPGDVITKIDGHDLQTTSYEENVARLQGRTGTRSIVFAERPNGAVIEAVILRSEYDYTPFIKAGVIKTPEENPVLRKAIDAFSRTIPTDIQFPPHLSLATPGNSGGAEPNYNADALAEGFYEVVRTSPFNGGRTVATGSCGYHTGKVATDGTPMINMRLTDGIWEVPVPRGNLSPIFNPDIKDETCNASLDTPGWQMGWGIGLELGLGPDGRAVVKSVMKGGPADNAGLCRGDTILAFERYSSTERQWRVSLGAGNGQRTIDHWNKQLSDWEQGGILIGVMRGNINLPTVNMDKKWAENPGAIAPPCPR